MKRLFILAPVAATVLAATLVAGCGGSSSPTGAASGGSASQSLTIGISVGPGNLNPALDESGLVNIMRSLTNESLFRLTPSLTATPDLVSTYGYVGTGNTTFEFTLKPGIRFTDGTPLNAKAVKTWLDYFTSAKGPFSTQLQISSIQTIGQYTVKLNLASPNPEVPVLLTQSVNLGAISSPAAVAHPSVLSTETYGVGPYVVDPAESTAGSSYTLVPSKYYYDPAGIHFSKVVVRVIPSSSAMLDAFRSGQLDFANLDPSVIASAQEPGVKIVDWPVNTDVVTLGDLTGPLASQQVRQALNYAINRSAITEAMVGKYGVPTSQLETDYSDPSLNNYYPYDPSKAKSLLAAAGYPNGFTMSLVDTGQITGNLGDPTMQAVAKYWQAIGVQVKITPAVSSGDEVEKYASKQYQAVQWLPGIASTYGFYNLLYAPHAALNVFGDSYPTLETLFQKAVTGSPAQQAGAWRQFNDAATEEAVNVPIYAQDTPYAFSTHLTGVQAGGWVPVATSWGWQG